VKQEYYGSGRTPGDPPHKTNVKLNSPDAHCVPLQRNGSQSGRKLNFTQTNIADETGIARVS
jgi:hypothetical protein